MGRVKKGNTLKTKEERAVSYLLRNARIKGKTQTDIAKAIGVSQPTVFGFIDNLCGETHNYRGVEYEIRKINGKYMAFNENYLQKEEGKRINKENLKSKGNNCNRKEDSEEILREIRGEFSDQFFRCNARTSERAVRLTRSVVDFPVIPKMRKEVIAIIRSNFQRKYYNDIVPHDNGVYIILIEPEYKYALKKTDLDERYKELNELYTMLGMAK